MPFWGRYVPVEERKAKAAKQVAKLRKRGKRIYPVELNGRTIASSFWGRGWCDHFESFSDFENRLPRGRAYVRNGSVCHLEILPGLVKALVAGTSLYEVEIATTELAPSAWRDIKRRCAGQVGSMIELLQGRLSEQVMSIVSDRDNGLFPKPGELKLWCSCPDWAVMCKHVAAVLYGVGSRLDTRPELLFVLRGVDAEELVSTEIALPAASGAEADALADDALGDIFGIDLEQEPAPAREPDPTPEPKAAQTRKRTRKTEATDEGRPGSRASLGKTPARKAASRAKTPSKPAQGKRRKARPKPLPPFEPTGEAVAALRERMGLSVSAFAEAVGVTPATVQRWESVPGPLRMWGPKRKALEGIYEATRDK